MDTDRLDPDLTEALAPAPYGASTCQPHLWHNDREVLVKQAQRAVA